MPQASALTKSRYTSKIAALIVPMNKKLSTGAFVGAMALASSSIDCKGEVIGLETYSLDFDASTIPCGDIDNFTPYDKERYCEGKDDSEVVPLESFYDTSEETRAKITAAVACVLEPLGRVNVEMKSASGDAVLSHIGGFARVKAGGTSTYDEGNKNYTEDRIYIADRRINSENNEVVYFNPEVTSLIVLHEIAHTLGLGHGPADSIMAPKIDHTVEYPFHFTRDEAELLLKNTYDQTTEENIGGLTKADERCVHELEALKDEAER